METDETLGSHSLTKLTNAYLKTSKGRKAINKVTMGMHMYSQKQAVESEIYMTNSRFFLSALRGNMVLSAVCIKFDFINWLNFYRLFLAYCIQRVSWYWKKG